MGSMGGNSYRPSPHIVALRAKWRAKYKALGLKPDAVEKIVQRRLARRSHVR
jgi:hypothetical protein